MASQQQICYYNISRLRILYLRRSSTITRFYRICCQKWELFDNLLDCFQIHNLFIVHKFNRCMRCLQAQKVCFFDPKILKAWGLQNVQDGKRLVPQSGWGPFLHISQEPPCSFTSKLTSITSIDMLPYRIASFLCSLSRF